ncbi:unnamed protein product, partial [Rotaria sordida]
AAERRRLEQERAAAARRRLQQEEAAATKIQASYRGFKDRQAFNERKRSSLSGHIALYLALTNKPIRY